MPTGKRARTSSLGSSASTPFKDTSAPFEATQFVQGPTFRKRFENLQQRLEEMDLGGLDPRTLLSKQAASATSADVLGDNFRRRRFAEVAWVSRSLLSRNFHAQLLSRLRLDISLHGANEPDGEIWVLVDRSRATYASQVDRLIGDEPCVLIDIVGAERHPIRVLPNRLRKYFQLRRTLRLPGPMGTPEVTHRLLRQALLALDLAKQADEAFSLHRPAAVFTYRDFTWESQVLVQTARARGIPTYTTQHGVYYRFAGRHDREWNLVFENTTSDNYICWGSFNKAQIRDAMRGPSAPRRILLLERPTSPRERQISVEKNSTERGEFKEIFIPLMGLLLEDENRTLLEMAVDVASRFELPIRIRPHPALSIEKYQAHLNPLAREKQVDLRWTDAKATPEADVSKSTLCVAGLTSMYHEMILHGVPTLYYDSGIELEEELPRALPGFKNADELAKQVELLASMTRRQWYELADPVCHQVYNRTCLDFSASQSFVGFVRKDLSSRSLSVPRSAPAVG